MILFSAPGSLLNKKRAWLLTTPFDKQLSVGAPRMALILGRDSTSATIGGAPNSPTLAANDSTKVTIPGAV